MAFQTEDIMMLFNQETRRFSGCAVRRSLPTADRQKPRAPREPGPVLEEKSGSLRTLKLQGKARWKYQNRKVSRKRPTEFAGEASQF